MKRAAVLVLAVALVLSIAVTPALADDSHHSGTPTTTPTMPTDPSMGTTMPTDPSMGTTMTMDPSIPMDPSMDASMATDPSMDAMMPPMDPAMPMMAGETMSDGTAMAAGEPMPSRETSTMPAEPMDPNMHNGMGDGDMSLPVPVMRVSGPDRFGTAVATSRSTFTTATSVVLANGRRFPDALVSSALAGTVRGPVLLTETDSIPSTVTAEIKRLGARTVYLVGSTTVISSAVRRRLESAGYSVQRVAGPNRYATAAAVAAKVAELRGMATLPEALLVSGDVPWDAISASPYAYSRRMPLLLVSRTGLPAETAGAITSLGIATFTAVGGVQPIPESVYAAVSRLTPGTDLRIAGDTRYTTAHDIAHHAIDKGWATAGYPGVAVGTAFPDALVGGSAVGAKGGVLLLTARDDLPASAEMLLVDHAKTAEVKHVNVFGGIAAVSNFVVQRIVALIQ